MCREARGVLLTLGVNFVGLACLIVYVGPVAVLFLFVVMTLNVCVSGARFGCESLVVRLYLS